MNLASVKKMPLLFLAMFCLSLSVTFLRMARVGAAIDPGTPQQVIQGTTRENDLKRRRLITFKECLKDHMDFEDGKFEDFGDFFKDDNGTEEKIVVGFSRDGRNGVMSCQTATLQGLTTLGPSDLNVLPSYFAEMNDDELAFAKYLTGKVYSDFDNPEDRGRINVDEDIPKDNRNTLIRTIDSVLGRPEFAAPQDPGLLRTERIFKVHSLVDICFSVEDTANLSGTGREGSFNINLGGDEPEVRLSPRPDSEVIDKIKDAGFIQENSAPTLSEIGDIPLGFAGFAGGAGVSDFNGFDAGPGNASRFYPIGKDLVPSGDGIVSCEFIAENKDWLEQNVIFENGELILVDESGNRVNSGGEAEAEDAPPSCESVNSSFKLAWILCGFVQFIDDSVQKLGDLVDSLLSIDAARYNNNDLRKAWSYFRNLASFMLIIIGLIMVFGQAVSKE